MQKLVLIADDDQDDGDLLFEAISNYSRDFRCLAFINAEKLLEYLDISIKKPDLIFLDFNMPCINGIECLKSLKADKRFTSIPVVICTTSKSPQDIEISYKEGASHFFTKPATYSFWKSEVANTFDSILKNNEEIIKCS